jgi:transposase InsO family protein
MLEQIGLSERVIQLRAHRGELAWRYQQRKARNGRRVREYLANMLPESDQARLAELRLLVPTACVALAPATPRQPGLFAGVPQVNEDHLRTLTERQREQVRFRLAVITPMLQWEEGHRPPLVLRDGRAVKNSDDLARYLGDMHNISRATIWKWVRGWREEAELGLARKRRRDLRAPRYFAAHPEAAKFVLAKYAELGATASNGRPSLKLIFDALMRELPCLSPDRTHTDWPCYSTVRAYLHRLPPVARDGARMPRLAHDAKYAPQLITDLAAMRVNEKWVTDHRIFDVIVYNDCFASLPRHAAFRPWHTTIEDMRTRAIVGDVICVTPSSRTFASALLQAISRFGLPEWIYCDNGRDFKKVGGAYVGTPDDVGSDGQVHADPAAQHLLGRLGIRVQYCVVRRPRSKQVESFYATESKRFDVIFGPAYAGRKPELRSDACREGEKQHKQWMRGERPGTPFQPASRFIALYQQWLKEFNCGHEHSGRGMNDRAPFEVMEELLPPGQRKIPDMAELQPLFWDRRELTVTNCAVQIWKHPYRPALDDEEGIRRMYGVNGTRVQVACNPDDVAFALAYDAETGKFLAHLVAQELVERGPQSQEQIQAVMRIGRRLQREIREAWSFIRYGVPSEMELLAERAGLPAETAPQILPAPQPSRRRLAALACGAAIQAEPQIGYDGVAERFFRGGE